MSRETGLVEWFATVLDEDERIALASAGKEWHVDGGYVDIGAPSGATYLGRAASHVARHDPARVLAQVEATRKILDLHAPAHDNVAARLGFTAPDMCHVDAEAYPCATVRLLAEPFAHLPGYQEGWRP